MKRNTLFLIVISILVMSLSGCYWNSQVEANQAGIVMADGVSVTQVVGPGRYTDMGWYAELKKVNTSAQIVEWADPDLVTKDKQPIGLTVAVTYARKRDKESVTQMWTSYNMEARDDEVLRQQVLTRIPRAAKEVTTRFTLDEMLGVAQDSEAGRQAVQSDLFQLLEVELAEINVELLDVGINNIAPSGNYMKLLEQKANAIVAVEVAQQETLKLKEQLAQEQAQTEIEIEIARRENLVAEEKAKVLSLNDRWFELQRLERLADVFDGDNVWFIDPDMDLTLLLSGQGGVIPIPQED